MKQHETCIMRLNEAVTEPVVTAAAAAAVAYCHSSLT